MSPDEINGRITFHRERFAFALRRAGHERTSGRLHTSERYTTAAAEDAAILGELHRMKAEANGAHALGQEITFEQPR